LGSNYPFTVTAVTQHLVLSAATVTPITQDLFLFAIKVTQEREKERIKGSVGKSTILKMVL
jgi:hypothetical protein